MLRRCTLGRSRNRHLGQERLPLIVTIEFEAIPAFSNPRSYLLTSSSPCKKNRGFAFFRHEHETHSPVCGIPLDLSAADSVDERHSVRLCCDNRERRNSV